MIALSLVMFGESLLDYTLDLDELVKYVLSTKFDCHIWKTQYKRELVNFGIFNSAETTFDDNISNATKSAHIDYNINWPKVSRRPRDLINST